jgi:hypothetical protein
MSAKYYCGTPWELYECIETCSSDSREITIKMQPCNRIYYSTVHWRLNMFRGAHRSSSGAPTVSAASGLHTHVVTGRSQVWVRTAKFIIVIEFIIPPFIEGSTCFEEHTAHHQELQLYLQPLACIRMWWPAAVKSEWELQSSHCKVPTQTWLRPVTTCVCKPEAANRVKAPDDERCAPRNMLSLQWTVE